jgi:PAS domain S-box-containing protein
VPAEGLSQVRDYAFIGLDPEGYITSWNAGAAALKGYTSDEAIGQHFSIFYPPEDREAGIPQRLLAAAVADDRVEHVGWRVRKDGVKFWGDVVITAVHDDKGQLTGFAKVTRDLTDQHKLEQAREAFFAGLTHDLKTPVTAIRGFAELLDGANPEQTRRLANRIIANSDRLNSLVDEILDFARLRSGGLTLRLEPLELGVVAQDVVAEMGAALGEHPVRLHVKGAPVLADQRALERVLANVLGNAGKYSPAFSTIDISTWRRKGRSYCSVTDRGRGIAREDLPTILDDFERGSQAQADGGSGLGLANVRRLMEVHKGSVELHSKVGRGTVVTLSFPAR